MKTHRGEILLALSMAGVAVSIALAGFPMIGILSLICGPVALLFLLIGVMMTRGSTVPIFWQAAGLGLLLLGVVVLVWVASGTGHLAFREAIHTERPSLSAPGTADWGWNAACWMIPAVLIGFGLRCWTTWSPRRCLGWGVIVLAIPPAVFLIYRILMLKLAISA
jgi:hypothetical protein